MAKVKQQDLDQALLESAAGDSYITCKILLDLGADPKAMSPAHWQNTPLHEAAEKGRIDICHLLMEYGAHINVRNGRGYTPLYMAVREKHKDLALILVSLGANTFAYAHKDESSLHNEWPLVCDRIDFRHMTPHSAAIRMGHVKRLSELFGDPNQRSDREFLMQLANEANKLKKPDVLAFIQAYATKSQIDNIRATATASP